MVDYYFLLLVSTVVQYLAAGESLAFSNSPLFFVFVLSRTLTYHIIVYRIALPSSDCKFVMRMLQAVVGPEEAPGV